MFESDIEFQQDFVNQMVSDDPLSFALKTPPVSQIKLLITKHNLSGIVWYQDLLRELSQRPASDHINLVLTVIKLNQAYDNSMPDKVDRINLINNELNKVRG
ncbi:hypothetical protein L1267_19065 [Pseudoalteromonas sp. OFAV1]|jgi:hypothetical protein|uniref:hypothetical protein n=1 Tax=Pseudoalteromonas sp. OFAV1 TaxID=2908892 RepID=UPI001F26F489|nr:hypothetical protein [Pseudoalteromonas sp. OFAV1]MCF2902475.1 hypothetical protein [Pseudoalteromonas sp. OFAV1]